MLLYILASILDQESVYKLSYNTRNNHYSIETQLSVELYSSNLVDLLPYILASMLD